MIVPASAQLVVPLIFVRHETASGVNGGTSTNTYQTRPLTNVQRNTIPGASLSTNYVILPAGTYDIDAWCSIYNADQSRCRLFNVTDGVVLSVGESAYGGINQAQTRLFDRITLASTKSISLEAKVYRVQATNGWGVGGGLDAGVEVHAGLKAWKVA